MDYKQYAKHMLELKKCDYTEELLEAVENELSLTFEKRYNAVCIDIDGVLVDTNLNSEGTVDIIGELLKKHIPIVFATGRGEGSTKGFVKSISKELYTKYNVSINDLKHISCICNDGELILYTSGNTEKLLDNVELLCSRESLENLSLMVDPIREQILSKFGDEVKIQGSFSESLDSLMGIRFVFENIQLRDELWKGIEECINKHNVGKEKFNITEGKYGDKLVIQIGTSDNAKSILEAEKRLGIPKDSMIRIFDEGKKGGNDYSILDSKQGFSTGTISEEPFGCIPILDEKFNKMEGIAATEYILKQLKIYPTICLENAYKERYKKQLAIAEKQIQLGRTEVIRKMNEQFCEKFGVTNGFEDVFDKETGSIKFYDYEWELINNDNPLKQIFNLKDDGKRKYSLEDDDSLLLRGADNYYFFIANCNKNNITCNDVVRWKDNNINFFSECLRGLEKINGNDNITRKLKLAVLDNLRNNTLVVLNAAMRNKYNNANVHIAFETYKKDDTINSCYDNCLAIERLMQTVCFEKLDDKFDENIRNVLNNSIDLLETVVNNIVEKNDENINAKCFRSFREIDNYIENYSTIRYAIEKIQEEKNLNDRDVSFNGVAYGGLELPFIAKVVLENRANVLTNEIFLNGNYNTRHHNNLSMMDDIKIQTLGNVKTSDSHNIVTDDNVLTGKTLQVVLNGLFNNNYNVDDLIAVRYPSLNRVEQMFYENHGAIDTTQYFTYIKGLLFPTPYSKLKETFDGDVSRKKYKDEFGVFNKTKDKVIKCIYKNGRYKRDSETRKYIDIMKGIE